jgi:group I intron endonuclease
LTARHPSTRSISGGDVSFTGDITAVLFFQDAKMKNVIYLATNRINGKGYVGQTKSGLKQRRRDHESKVRKGSALAFHSALRKYGFENFVWEVLHAVENPDNLSDLEIASIAKHDTLAPHGYNLTSGGESCTPSEETKQKIREARARQIFTPEAIAKRSATMKKIKWSPEIIEKRGLAMRGIKRTEEQKQRISEARKAGKSSHSSESNFRRGEAQRGKNKKCSACGGLGHNKATCEVLVIS